MIEDKIVTERTPAELLRRCEYWLEHTPSTKQQYIVGDGYCRIAGHTCGCREENQINFRGCLTYQAYAGIHAGV